MITATIASDLTPGFLPVQAFRHMEPTAMAALRLENDASLEVISHPEEADDAILYVRSRDEPVAVLYVRPASALTNPVAVHAAAVEATRGMTPLARTPNGGPMRASTVAIVIPTGGRSAQLDRCLDSVRAHAAEASEVLIVDNRPGRGETAQVVARHRALDDRIRYIAEPRPGSSVARNRGISETRAEILAFTDDDVVLDPGWLKYLVGGFADSEVSVVTGLVLPLELITAAQKRFEQYAGFSKGLRRRTYDMAAQRASERVLYPYWGGVFGSGNSVAFRRSALLAAGGFDPALGAGSPALAGADIEAMSQAILRGGRLLYEPRSLCWHEHRREDRALARQIYNYGAGLTALFTKAALQDPGFTRAAARSLPTVLGRRFGHNDHSAAIPALPPELQKLQHRGMRIGPRLYFRSARWARRSGLYDIVSPD